MKRDDYLHIRINTELKEQIRLIAEEEGRSLSNFVESLLKDAVKGYIKG